MMGWYGQGMGGGGWLVMALVWVLLLTLVVWLVVRLLPSRHHDDTAGASHESPQQILDRRLANGELSVEQYRELRSALDMRHEATS